MDFIERAFHLAPDHGNGTLEAVILIAVLALSVYLAMSAIRRRLASETRRRSNERTGLPV
jgi:hypothetical protein